MSKPFSLIYLSLIYYIGIMLLYTYAAPKNNYYYEYKLLNGGKLTVIKWLLTRDKKASIS